MSQGGMVSIFQDFPMSPDMVSEVKVLTSNYAPEYGSSTSGPDHGGDAVGRQRLPRRRLHLPPQRRAQRDAVGRGDQARVQPQQLRREHRRPGEGARSSGATRSRATSSSTTRAIGRRAARTRRRCRFPRCSERNGDFTDWRDASGNLIPIYDPATIRPDGRGGFIKDQFMGCNGNQPNVICPSRINPIVRAWLRRAAQPDERRPAEQLPGAAHPRHDSRQLRLLPGALRPADRQQRPHVRQLLAPARAGQVRLDAAAADRQRDLLRSAELVGQPLQLGSHVQQQRC